METKSCIGNSVLISKKDFELSKSVSALSEAERLTENYVGSGVGAGKGKEDEKEGENDVSHLVN